MMYIVCYSEGNNCHIINCIHYSKLLVRDKAWFVCLYGEIIHELSRVDYRPYRLTNYDDAQCRLCT